MEENEKKSNENVNPVNEAEVKEETKTKGKFESGKVVNFIKSHIKLIAIIAIIIIVAIVVLNIIIVSPKEVVKKFVSSLNDIDAEKAFSYFDWAGAAVFYELDEDDLEDFWEEYKDFQDSDDYEEYMEDIEEYLASDDYDDINDELENYDISIDVKEIKDVEKVGKHLYSIKVKLEIEEDGDEEVETVTFYVMKSGLKSYLVSLPDEIWYLY